MNFFRIIAFLFVLSSVEVFASCGLKGTLEERLNDCKSEGTRELGFQVISVTKSGQYLYNSRVDTILSPAFPKTGSFKCLSPYRQLRKFRRVFNQSPRFERTPEGHFRCFLKDASRYLLLENETLL